MDLNSAEPGSNFPELRPAARKNARWGYLVAVLCLVWVFHDVHAERLWRQIGAIHWGWVMLAVGVDVLAYICQGFRWQLLLRPLGRTSVLKATEAVYAGLFVNEISPLRAGEALRIFLMARQLGVPVPSVISSVTVERLFDGVWLAIAVAAVSLSIPLPLSLRRAADTLDVILLVAILAFVALAFRRPVGGRGARDPALPKRWNWIQTSWQHFRTTLCQISFSKPFFFAFGVSSLVVLLQALSFWLVMWACGLHLSLWVGVSVFIIVHLGTAIPNAPANVGAYQFFTVVGLTLFGVEKTLATGFSVVVFLILTLPLLLVGLVAISRTGMSLAALRAKVAA